MSRHKFVKTLNLNDELEDYDGVANYADDEDVTADDKKQLDYGKTEVRSILGTEGIVVTDAEIEESLWHYYYDVDKTVNYLRGQKNPQPKKSKKKAGVAEEKFSRAKGALTKLQEATTSELWNTPELGPIISCCSSSLPSAADFFKDSPWLDIPIERRGEILIEPLYPRGGLLGGSSSQGTGKISKLAALAAARKKKDQGRSQDGSSGASNTSVALLDRLSGKAKSTSETPGRPSSETQISKDRKQEPIPAHSDPLYSARIRKCSVPNEEEKVAEVLEPPATEFQELKQLVVVPVAAPSMFAKVMFGMADAVYERQSKRMKRIIFALPQGPDAEINPFAGPSPDDEVSRAQQHSKGLKQKGGTQHKQNGGASIKSVTRGIENVTIDDSPKSKNKNLDVATEFQRSNAKNAVSFVVIGHVDAGKSTLMGRLLYDLKVIDQRTIDAYKKEAESIGKASFALAWVLDQGTEERRRGVTIDIATNTFSTPLTNFTILDAPGHRDFIPNMIAGASQADFAVLVIDASTGSFESGLKGQTREHALLVRSMGVFRLVIAINKLDAVSWSHDRFTEISTQLSAFLTAAGFQARNLSFIPCSGLTGENIVNPPINPLLLSWYPTSSPVNTNSTFLSALESSEPHNRTSSIHSPLRLTINDIFRSSITNPLSISGRIESGSLQVGDILLLLPSGERTSIRGITLDSAPADYAVPGQSPVIHLSPPLPLNIHPGDVITHPHTPVPLTSLLTIKVLAFSHVMPMYIEVHRGRLHVPGRITELVALLDKGTGGVLGKGKRPRLVKPGQVARVRVELDGKVPLEAPARVVLRQGGETIAAGLLE